MRQFFGGILLFFREFSHSRGVELLQKVGEWSSFFDRSAPDCLGFFLCICSTRTPRSYCIYCCSLRTRNLALRGWFPTQFEDLFIAQSRRAKTGQILCWLKDEFLCASSHWSGHSYTSRKKKWSSLCTNRYSINDDACNGHVAFRGPTKIIFCCFSNLGTTTYIIFFAWFVMKRRMEGNSCLHHVEGLIWSPI